MGSKEEVDGSIEAEYAIYQIKRVLTSSGGIKRPISEERSTHCSMCIICVKGIMYSSLMSTCQRI